MPVSHRFFWGECSRERTQLAALYALCSLLRVELCLRFSVSEASGFDSSPSPGTHLEPDGRAPRCSLCGDSAVPSGNQAGRLLPLQCSCCCRAQHRTVWNGLGSSEGQEEAGVCCSCSCSVFHFYRPMCSADPQTPRVQGPWAPAGRSSHTVLLVGARLTLGPVVLRPYGRQTEG